MGLNTNSIFNGSDRKLRECFECHNVWYTGGKSVSTMATSPMVNCPLCMSTDVKTYDTLLPAEVDIEEVTNETE